MKILFSLTYYAPYISGLTNTARVLAEDFADKGNQVKVLCIRDNRNLPDTETINKVQIVRMKPLFRLGKGFATIDWLYRIVHYIKEADVLFIHLPQPEGLISALWAKIFSKKTVSMYHCDVVLPGKFVSNLIQFALDVNSFLILVLSNKIIASSKDYADHSRLLTHFKNKIVYIYLPVPERQSDPKSKNKIRQLAGIGFGDVVLGMVGRMANEKGFEYLLKAIPLIRTNLFPRKIKILIVGPPDPVGETQYRKRVADLISEYKQEVILLGKLPENLMTAFYQILDILVFPSINSTESFGIVQIEAMREGVPVIASDLPGMRIPVKMTGNGLLVKPKDPGEIARAVTEIMTDAKSYNHTNIAEQLFNYQKTITAYERIVLY